MGLGAGQGRRRWDREEGGKSGKSESLGRRKVTLI